MHHSQVVLHSNEYRIIKEPVFLYVSPGPAVHLIEGKLYTRRKNKYPRAFTSDNDKEIDGIFAEFWEWIGSPPFIYTGEVIVESNAARFYPEKYFGFFHHKHKIWIRHDDLRYIKKFRKTNN